MSRSMARRFADGRSPPKRSTDEGGLGRDDRPVSRDRSGSDGVALHVVSVGKVSGQNGASPDATPISGTDVCTGIIPNVCFACGGKLDCDEMNTAVPLWDLNLRPSYRYAYFHEGCKP